LLAAQYPYQLDKRYVGVGFHQADATLDASCQLPKLLPLSTHLPLSSHRINSHRKSGVPFVPSATTQPVGQLLVKNAEIVPTGVPSPVLPLYAVVWSVPSGNFIHPVVPAHEDVSMTPFTFSFVFTSVGITPIPTFPIG